MDNVPKLVENCYPATGGLHERYMNSKSPTEYKRYINGSVQVSHLIIHKDGSGSEPFDVYVKDYPNITVDEACTLSLMNFALLPETEKIIRLLLEQ